MVSGRPNLRQLTLIDRYLARSIAVPLLGSLVLAAMLLVLDKMLRLFQYVVDAGGPVSVVWRMLASLLPEYLSLGIPIGLMLGILLAFRKLALSSELDAMRGIGVGFGRLLRVPYAFAIPLMVLNLFIVGYLEPWSHYRYEGLRFDLKSGALGAAIKVAEFNQLGHRLTLRIDRSEHKGTQLHGIFVEMDDKNGMTVAATAERGRFLLEYVDLLIHERTGEAEGFRHVAPQGAAGPDSLAQGATHERGVAARGHDRWVINKLRALNSWYTKGLDNCSHLRVSINAAESIPQLRDIIETFFAAAAVGAAR